MKDYNQEKKTIEYQQKLLNDEIQRVKNWVNGSNLSVTSRITGIAKEYRNALKKLYREFEETSLDIDSFIGESRNILQLEVGKTYRTVDGSTARIISALEPGNIYYDMGYRFVSAGSGQYYTNNGRTYIEEGTINPSDLIAEIEQGNSRD